MNKVNLWVECVLITYDIVSVYPVGDKLKRVCELLATSFCCQWLMHMLGLVWRLARIVNKYTVGHWNN